jgi:hypothetical protein
MQLEGGYFQPIQHNNLEWGEVNLEPKLTKDTLIHHERTPLGAANTVFGRRSFRYPASGDVRRLVRETHD